MQCPRCLKGDLIVTLTGMLCPNCGYDLFADDDHIPGNEPGWDPIEFNRQQFEQSAQADQPVIRPLPPRGPSRTAAPGDSTPIPIDLPFTIYPHDVYGLEGRELARFRSRCMDAAAALADKDLDRARDILTSTLELTTHSDQVWLFLAGLARTRDEQRQALENALACDTSNLIALEALARLRGDLDDPARFSSRLEPGQADQVEVRCPHCGGQLTFNTGAQQVTCYHCGQPILDLAALGRGDEAVALPIGLLKRKYHPRGWNIGERWVRCGTCGATTTLSRHTLSRTCRFCQSQQVTVESTDHRFEQPDFIVPFEIDQAAAHEAIMRHLTTGLRVITRLFADHVARVDVQGVYLPFWVFDAEMNVNWSWTNARDRGVYPVLLGDVLWCASPTVARTLLIRAEPFDLLRGKEYDPRLLAVFPAELSQDDIARASLEVRPRLQGLAEQRATQTLNISRPSSGTNGFGSKNDGPGRLVLHPTTRFMSYRLGLLPVWVGQLVEDDGDTQPLVVNGQTGEVALGRVVR